MWFKWKGDITSFVTPKVRCIPRQFWKHVCVCESMFGYVTELGPFFLIISATLPRLFRPRACMSVFVVCACLCLFCNLLSSPLNYRVFSRVHATLYPTVSVRRSVGRSVTHLFFQRFSGSFSSLLLPNRKRLILPCIRPCFLWRRLLNPDPQGKNRHRGLEYWENYNWNM